jgi:DNA polymerase III sliding clamp (beta) subunit (PCNA family)
MEITAQKITDLLGIVKPAIVKKTNLPIIRNTRLTYVNTSLQATATNLTLAIKAKMPAHMNELDCLIPYASFLNTMKNSGGIINLTEHERTLTIESSAGEQKFKGLSDLNDYPDIFEEMPPNSVTVDMKDFIRDIKRACGRADTTGNRLNLHTIHFNGEASRLESSDGARLATIPVDWLLGGTKKLFDAKSLKSILVAIKKSNLQEQYIEVGFTEKNLIIKTQNAEFLLRQVDGDFPNINNVNSEVKGPQATFVVKDLLKALKVAKIMSHKFIVFLWFMGNELVLQGGTQGLGIAEHRIYGEVDPLLEKKLYMVNHKYLKIALEACKTHEVTITFGVDGRWRVDEEIVLEARATKNSPVVLPPKPNYDKVIPIESKRDLTITKTSKKTVKTHKLNEKPRKTLLYRMIERSKVVPAPRPEKPTHDAIWIASHERTSTLGKKYIVKSHWRKRTIT